MKTYRAAEKALREFRKERVIPVCDVVSFIVKCFFFEFMNRRPA
jgi:hypothetical protein